MSEMNCKKNLETTHRHGSFKTKQRSSAVKVLPALRK